MPPDNFSGLQLRISAKKLGALLAAIGAAIATAVGSYFTVQTKQNVEIERRLTSIETKIELLLPARVSQK